MIKQRTGNNIHSSLSQRMAASPLQLLTESDCNFRHVSVPLLQCSQPQHSWCRGKEGSIGLGLKLGKLAQQWRQNPKTLLWKSKSCLEHYVNSRQEEIKVNFIHSCYCLYIFAIMFIDMFEWSTSCSSVQLPVKMGHLSRNKLYRS